MIDTVGVIEMPKKPNPDLKDGAVYKSQKKASENWERENPQEKLIIRMPKGRREVISKYVEKKAIENPDDRRYSTDKGRPSVNAYINALIDKDMQENPSQGN